ncbi:MAG: glycosyltransferase [Candidatus Marinimicrobia bacterium]|nr:glycosyltransferase [Candidatus Neomarinimicrobiota bacterium]
MPNLLIISHTEHFQTDKGIVVGWEPTIREINSLNSLFDKIYHIAPMYNAKPHGANGNYEKNIIFIPIKPAGGNKIIDKLKILFFIPNNLLTIIKMINKVDWIHFRSPTNLGLYVLPLLSLLRKKKKWVKYAGNWKQKDIPVSYALQRWWLKNNFQHSIVTINGIWKKQPKHLVSFFNPCINDDELKEANRIGYAKFFKFPINICFVGRLDQNKGYLRLIKVLETISSLTWIGKINFVGGSEDDHIPKMNIEINKINFCGWLNREKLNNIYKKSHFIILPTKSEGFPKVLAEAGAYGCIPIVSDLSPVNQLIINDHNGFLLFDLNIDSIKDCLLQIPVKKGLLKEMSKNIIELSNKFTYRKYTEAINRVIVNA